MTRLFLLAVLTTSACGSKLDPPAESTVADTGTPTIDSATPTSDTSPDGAPDAVLPTEDRTCKRLADAMCGTATETCCKTLGITYAGGGCRESVMAYCNARIDAVSLGRATYDDSKLEDCAKSWTSMITTCQQELVPYVRASAICAQLFNGKKAPGESCVSAIECNAPAGSVSYCDAMSKRCRASSISPEGGPCNFTGSTLRYCDDGLYCDVTGAMSVCRKELAPGADCSESNYIACGYSSTCVAGKCGPGLAGGEACTEAHQCSSWTCAMGKCNPVLYKMVDKALCNASTSG